MMRFSSTQLDCLEAAERCRLRGLDGCAFRGAEQRTARSLVWRGLLREISSGLVDDLDFDSGREYRLWSITPAGQKMLAWMRGEG